MQLANSSSGWFPSILAQHLNELMQFAQFALSLIVGDVRRFANFQHPAAADKPQSPKQKLTLSIRQFELQQVTHRILIRRTDEAGRRHNAKQQQRPNTENSSQSPTLSQGLNEFQ